MNIVQEEQKVSAVVATKGRSNQLIPLLRSLSNQTRPIDEIIIIDQNLDSRLSAVIEMFPKLRLRHIRKPDLKGANASRNFGWRVGVGSIFFFPDDDCWYPTDFLERTLRLFSTTSADIVSGRASDELGKSINGRFEKKACWVNQHTAWTSQIEWVFFVRVEVLQKTGGFDEMIGPGAGTPWGANEVQDLSLTALDYGFRQYYDPGVFGYHPEFRFNPRNKESRNRLIAYAQGFGYVLAKHKVSPINVLMWLFRPLGGAFLGLLRLRLNTFVRQIYTFRGRAGGYILGLYQRERKA